MVSAKKYWVTFFGVMKNRREKLGEFYKDKNDIANKIKQGSHSPEDIEKYLELIDNSNREGLAFHLNKIKRSLDKFQHHFPRINKELK